jgi:3-oxoacyl-[acyl-carrier-protein] synthase II
MRPVFLAAVDSGARTAAADTWSGSWSELLRGTRRFQRLARVVPEWPDDAPVACLHGWPVEFVPGGRARALAVTLGEDSRALHDALLTANPDLVLSVVVASSHGEAQSVSEFAEHRTGRAAALSADAATSILSDTLLKGFLEGLGVMYPGATLSAACASATVATGLAASRIGAGMCDACFVVSLDVLSRVAHAGFTQIGAMSRNGVRPFDRARDGTTIGEAGIVLLLVGEQVSLPADVRFVVRVEGFGQACDARHPVEPSVEGVCFAVSRALADAGRAASDLAAVYWHGTGTVQNDRTEAGAALRLFGERAPSGTSTKATFGHAMGASGALSVRAAAETLATCIVPPIAGLEDPEFSKLNLVMGDCREIPGGPVAVVSLGFGGLNAVLVLSSPSHRSNS